MSDLYEFFLNIKINAQVYDEQNIKNLRTESVTSAKQSHVGVWGKRTTQ